MDHLWQGRVLGITLLELGISLGLLMLTLVVTYAVRWMSPWLRRLLARRAAAHPLMLIQQAVHAPLLATLWIYGLALTLYPLLPAHPATVRWVLVAVAHGLGLLMAAWLALRLTRRLVQFIDSWAQSRRSLFDRYFIPLFVRGIPAVVPVLALFVVLPLLTLPERQMMAIRDLASLLLITVIATVLIQAVNMAERLMAGRLESTTADKRAAQRVQTQVAVLRKIALFIIVTLALASMLMVFEKVRQLGASILASAGILSLTVGIAAQQVLGNLIAGIQIAFSQPIRLNDAVVVEGEFGHVEELTLTYGVVRLWDERRLVLPIKYFIDKPFQNWTRRSAELIGVVYLYVDYDAPVETLREELQRIVAASPLWDQRVCKLQVNDASERTMQLRAQVSAANGSDAFALRCLVRERLIAYMREHYPEALPRLRTSLAPEVEA